MKTLLLSLFMFIVCFAHAQYRDVIKGGTMVIIETKNRIQSYEESEGNHFEAFVKYKVKSASGKVCINDNAVAKVLVKSIDNGSPNRLASIEIEAYMVRTVDGQFIRLEGDVDIIKAEAIGEVNVTIHPKREIIGRIVDDQVIECKYY